MSKLERNEKELLSRVNEVLYYLWDPIGVSDVPEARDEYDSYALQVFSLLKKKTSQEKIANYLSQIVTDNMGLTGNNQHDKNIARILINWMEFFEEDLNFY